MKVSTEPSTLHTVTRAEARPGSAGPRRRVAAFRFSYGWRGAT